MAFKLKLPDRFSLGRSASGPGTLAPPGGPGGPGESVALPVARARPTITLRQLQRGAAWFGGLFFVFILFAWINMPTEAIAWRLSQEAKKAGMVVDIGDVYVSPLGRVSLYDVTWSFPPQRVDEDPVPFVAERVDVRVAPIRYLFGNVHASITAHLDEGQIEGTFSRTSSETQVHLEIKELPLYAVPKFQQTIGAPVRGEFGMTVDLTAPDNHFEDATGMIDMTCRECTMGDGASKLYVPGAKKGGMLEKGMTVPEIDFGELHGSFAIVEGVARLEEFVSESDDITIQISGEVRLHDPFSKSEFGPLIIKVFVSEQLQEKSTEVKLMVATSGKSQKLKKEDLIEGQSAGLGYKLMGTVGRPKLKGIYSKSRAQRLREARDRRRDAEERRKKRAADRKAKEAARKAEAREPTPPDAEAEAEGEETSDDQEDANPIPEPRLGKAAIAPAVIPEAGAGTQPGDEPADDGGEGGDDEGNPDGTDENGENPDGTDENGENPDGTDENGENPDGSDEDGNGSEDGSGDEETGSNDEAIE